MDTDRSKVMMIGLGGVIVVCMLVTAAFALGTYVGEYGWTRQGLRYAGGPPGLAAQPGGLGGSQPGVPRPAGPSQFGQGPQDAGLPGPAAQPGGPGAPQLGPLLFGQGLPPGPPQVIGRIQQISEASLEVLTPDGPRLISISDQTKVQNETGQSLTLNDLQPGDAVAVFGQFSQGGGQLQAEILVRLPPK